MPRTTIDTVDIQFGDCDPAGIVFFANFLRRMDAASLAFFMECGAPPRRELVKMRGIVGKAVLEIHAKFIRAATCGEPITISAWVEEWRDKVFVHMHRVPHGRAAGVDLICEGREVRAFIRRDADKPERLGGMPVPEDIKAPCA